MLDQKETKNQGCELFSGKLRKTFFAELKWTPPSGRQTHFHSRTCHVAQKPSSFSTKKFQGRSLTQICALIWPLSFKLPFILERPHTSVCILILEVRSYKNLGLMLSIEKVEGNTYKVRERLKWSFLPFSFTYTFNCFVDEEKSEVRFEATIMKFTRMVLCFSLVPSEGGTRIQEQVSLRSPLPIHGFMQGLLKEQHAILFQQIEKQKSSDRPGFGSIEN